MGVNYEKTLSAVADDCPVTASLEPPLNPEKPSIAAAQFALISEHPYHHTSEDVIFQVHVDRQGIPEADRPTARQEYFSKGRACLRTSPLAKKFGWGLHSDDQGRLALVAMESGEYQRFLSGDNGTSVVKAMRSSKA